MVFSIGYTITDVLREFWIRNNAYGELETSKFAKVETSMFAIVDITDMISLTLFAGSVFWYRKHLNPKWYCRNVTAGKQKPVWEVCCVAFLLVILVLLTFATPIVGYYRDAICEKDKSKKHLLALFHAAVRVGIFSSMSALCCAFAMLVSNSAEKWVKNVSENAYKDWDVTTNPSVQEFVDKNFFTFYCNYTKLGKESKIVCDALQSWFMVHYIAYLLGVLVELMLAIRLSQKKNSCAHTLDVINTVSYIVFDVLTFFIPYYMVTWLNGLHDKYYREMREQFFMINIKNGTSTFKFIPGNSEPNEDNEMKCITYYNIAMGKPMTKRTDFDFVPAILGISIPLENTGYTFTILVSVISIIFKAMTYS